MHQDGAEITFTTLLKWDVVKYRPCSDLAEKGSVDVARRT